MGTCKLSLHVRRTCIAIGLSLNIAACAHDTPLSPQVAPIRPPPALCLPIPDEPDPQGGVIRPITPKEIDAFDRLVDYELNIRLYAREGWGRAQVARDTYCHD